MTELSVQAPRPRPVRAAVLGGLAGGLLSAIATAAVLLSKTRLWTSSSNWTKKQLRRYWQTGVLMYNDRALTREFDVRFESMRACGLPGGCGSWRPSVFGTKLSAAYRLLSVNRVWVDAGFDWRQGDAGDGTRVIFSPTRPHFDPVTSELARYSCTPR